jgi:hypothetical protein
VFRDTFRSRTISLIRLALDEERASDPRDRLHDQHPSAHLLPTFGAGSFTKSNQRGSKLDADYPSAGSLMLVHKVRSGAATGHSATIATPAEKHRERTLSAMIMRRSDRPTAKA